MSQTQKPKTRVFELNGVLQNFHRAEKGNKVCKQPHTALTFLTRLMKPEELDALLHGGVYGHKVDIRIEVVVGKPDDTSSKEESK